MKAFHFAKCHKSQLFLGLVLFFALASFTRASASTVSITGDGSQTNSASISWNDSSNDGTVYLFLNGISIKNRTPASADANSNSPKDFESSFFSGGFESLPYPAGDYQAILIASDIFGNRDGHCGAGISSSSCISGVLGNGLGGRVVTSTVYTVTAATSSTSTVQEVSNPQQNIILSFFLFVISFAVMLYSYSIFRMK